MDILEKALSGSPEYLVFFDNVRVDHLVKSYTTQLACDGSMGSASVEMVYVPGLYRLSKLNNLAEKAGTTGEKTSSDTAQKEEKPVSFNWPYVLKNGSKGDSVKEMQKTLLDLGFSGVGAVDGSFGPKTKSAVMEFQKSRGLVVDGLCGPKTQAAIKSAMEAKNGKANTAPKTTNMPNGPTASKFSTEEIDVDGIEDSTNLRIFEKNIFTGKYIMIFDGNIRSRSLSRMRKSITYSAIDYLRWHDRTTVPIAISMEDAISPSEQLKWMAQGINMDSVKKVNTLKEIGFKGKTIEEMFKEVAQQTIGSNKLYIESDCVVFDRPLQRVKIMGDIDENLRKAQVIDYMVTSSVSSMGSLYVMMNDVVKSVLLEYYQDRDGAIRIKPPFWSEPVLKNHTIDPAMIIDDLEATNWDQAYSRVIVSGGLEDWQENQEDLEKSILTPVSVYDIDGRKCNSDSGTKISSGIPPINPTMGGGSNTGTYLDQYRISSGYLAPRTNYYHQGVDFAMPEKTKLYHAGPTGIARHGSYGKKAWGGYVDVYFEAGPYQGGYVRYAHMHKRDVIEGQIIKPGDYIGLSGGNPSDKNSGNTTGPHLHLEVRLDNGKTVNPLDYLRKTRHDTVEDYNQSSATSFKIGAELPVGNDDIIKPNSFEKRYGPSVYLTSQPMIKFSTAGAVNSNYGSAFGALDAYSKFLLHYLNSSVDMLNLTVLPMPWLRAGFNVWVDPLGSDKVYYLERINRQGSAAAGCMTTLTLKMGRQRKDFVSGNLIVGAQKTGKNDNVFINVMKQTAKDFGEVITDYDSIKTAITKFYTTEFSVDEFVSERLSNKNHLKHLYAGVSNAKPVDKEALKQEMKANGELSRVLGPSEKDSFKIESWRYVLRKNSKGEDVENLQKALMALGYSEVETIDGSFGPKTDSAVRRFQKDNDLAVDGLCGPNTKEMLKVKTGS